MASSVDTGAETALETSREDFASTRNELYFVDASVPSAEALMVGLGEGSRVYALENTSDVFAQIEAALAAAGGAVDAIHIYSHGREGALELGGRWVDASTLADCADILARIGEALARGADILLYGCNTGAGPLGTNFVRTLAELTGADVAASNDVTGPASLDGDWDLESTAGAVETAPKSPLTGRAPWNPPTPGRPNRRFPAAGTAPWTPSTSGGASLRAPRTRKSSRALSAMTSSSAMAVRTRWSAAGAMTPTMWGLTPMR